MLYGARSDLADLARRRRPPGAGSTMRSSTPGCGSPAERSRRWRGPSGSWSSARSAVMAPVVSVRP